MHAATAPGPKPYDVTAPLALRWRSSGTAKVVAACFPHPDGLLYLDLFWHRQTPAQAAHLLRGELTGEGPWRIGDCVISVLGCHNTDPDLADDFARWREYLESDAAAAEYPPPGQIRDIARLLGASV
ncbi:MAG: hypothetical protein PVJ30_02025 [Thiohalocapsa sp.]|jgi:hypothetical protein|uniref:hypothetical protein n=1 Tax=Thiohalocapsa sp. TaxID=2497641 RepID=UPI0025EB9007|nr:hypothetical protein [Thiohalocapsa sp.]